MKLSGKWGGRGVLQVTAHPGTGQGDGCRLCAGIGAAPVLLSSSPASVSHHREQLAPCLRCGKAAVMSHIRSPGEGREHDLGRPVKFSSRCLLR